MVQLFVGILVLIDNNVLAYDYLNDGAGVAGAIGADDYCCYYGYGYDDETRTKAKA